MEETIFINGDGVFEIDGRAYRIPKQFSTREALSYRSLVATVPESTREKMLTVERRDATETFLLRRAAACVIPGFSMDVSESLSPARLRGIKRWITRHRPALSDHGQLRGRSLR